MQRMGRLMTVWLLAIGGAACDDSESGEPETDAPAEQSDTSDVALGELDDSDTETADLPELSAADCGFDAGIAFDPRGSVWQLRSADGATCVKLTRRDDSEPDIIYKAVPYTLLELVVGHAQTVVTIDDPAGLSYTPSHHNWADVAQATQETAHYRLAIDYADASPYGFTFTLEVSDLTGATLWGPLLLEPV